MTAAGLPNRVRSSDEPIRYYFDESALGLAAAVASARSDSIFPGHPRSPIKAGTLDPVWVPVVAGEGWIVVMRDKKIYRRPAELAALAANPLRLLVMTKAGQLNVWEQLRILLRYWDQIEEQASEPAPWLAALTGSGVRLKAYPT